MLIEVAKKKKDYVPEVSFGTHFFQDLVEARIRYLPLYPDEKNMVFNEKFFQDAPNLLKRILPEFKKLEKVIKVINVSKMMADATVSVIMDGDNDQALGFIKRK
jgi:hypothetical protein